MIYLGADHNGYFLKEKLKADLNRRKIAWRDCGAHQYNKADDYVDYAVLVAHAVKAGDYGILICGSGHGMVIAANKVSGSRAIMPLDVSSARWGRHDDAANILVLSAWHMSFEQIRKIIMVFLTTRPGRADRYRRRLRKIKELER